MIKALIAAIFLSQALIGGTHGSDRIQLADNNPFSGASSISVTLARDTFSTPKAPISYAAIWDNGLKQTAQQYVAILSLLQSRVPEDYDVLTRVRRDWLRLRDRQVIEDIFQKWK